MSVGEIKSEGLNRMMRIERMQEQLQLPQQLNNKSKEFFGVRRIESFVAQPRNLMRPTLMESKLLARRTIPAIRSPNE